MAQLHTETRSASLGVGRSYGMSVGGLLLTTPLVLISWLTTSWQQGAYCPLFFSAPTCKPYSPLPIRPVAVRPFIVSPFLLIFIFLLLLQQTLLTNIA